jgi:hypothetical protein
MSYTVSYRHAFNTTTEQWHGPLDEAQASAMSCVRSGAADYVEIRGPDGELVLCYPGGAAVVRGHRDWSRHDETVNSTRR